MINKSISVYKILIIRVILLFVVFQFGIVKSNAQNTDSLEMDSIYHACRTLSIDNQDSAFIFLDELIAKAKQNNYHKRLGQYYCLKGRVLLNNENDLESSLKYFLMADAINSKAKSKELEIEINQNLAYYYFKNENYDEAQNYIYYLIHNFKNCNNQLLKSKVLNIIGLYYSDISYASGEDYLDSAIYFFNKSVEIGIENNYRDVVSSGYINIGISNYDKQNYNEAIKNYLLAEKECIIINDSIGLAAIYSNIGSVYFDKKDYKKAIEYYQKAKEIYSQIENAEGNYQIRYLLSDANANMQNYKSAYFDYKTATDIYDSTYSIEKESIINDLLVKYETEKKENEIILKTEKLALEKTRSKNRSLIIYGLATLIFLLLVIGLFVMQNIRNKNKLMAKEVELKNQEINKILSEQEIKSYSALLEGQDKERQRIASDLHDRLGGLLSTIKAYFTVIEDKISTLEDRTIEQHDKASKLLNKAVEEVRNISHDLHSGVLKNFGLAMALSDLKSTIELTGTLKVDISIFGNKHPLEAKQEIQIYRIIQELFSNTMKHAKAKQVTVQIAYEPNHINIIFEDDGIGFDITKVSKGIGLKNIEARVQKLQGNVNIDSRIGRGTITIIEIPIS